MRFRALFLVFSRKKYLLSSIISKKGVKLGAKAGKCVQSAAARVFTSAHKQTRGSNHVLKVLISDKKKWVIIRMARTRVRERQRLRKKRFIPSSHILQTEGLIFFKNTHTHTTEQNKGNWTLWPTRGLFIITSTHEFYTTTVLASSRMNRFDFLHTATCSRPG